MSDYNIALPSKPRVVSESERGGTYEIDGLYPGYGYTLGNSLRRIILSSLPGAAVTHVKIPGVSHEFSTIEGVKEDVVTMLLNIRRIRFKILTDEPQTISLDTKGPKVITAADFKLPGQVEVLNPEQKICEITGKVSLEIELKAEKGLGYIPKEQHQKERVEIGTEYLDGELPLYARQRLLDIVLDDLREVRRQSWNLMQFPFHIGDQSLFAGEAPFGTQLQLGQDFDIVRALWIGTIVGPPHLGDDIRDLGIREEC